MEGKEENYNQRDKKERRLNSVYVIASWEIIRMMKIISSFIFILFY
jgi:hypothetical protein